MPVDHTPTPPTTEHDVLQAERHHVIAQLSAQLVRTASAERDHCRSKVNTVQTWLHRMQSAASSLRTASTMLGKIRMEHDDIEKGLSAAKTDEQRAELQRQLDKNDDEMDDYQSAVDVNTDVHDDARRHYDHAVNALENCRKHHPYEHECGERGGPGIRRQDGKCYSWDELRRLSD
jgi:predicted  nucleic acid-binding Zn-ribbon protein